MFGGPYFRATSGRGVTDETNIEFVLSCNCCSDKDRPHGKTNHR